MVTCKLHWSHFSLWTGIGDQSGRARVRLILSRSIELICFWAWSTCCMLLLPHRVAMCAQSRLLARLFLSLDPPTLSVPQFYIVSEHAMILQCPLPKFALLLSLVFQNCSVKMTGSESYRSYLTDRAIGPRPFAVTPSCGDVCTIAPPRLIPSSA